MLLSTVISQVINIGNNDGQSAYGDDWDDMSAFRQDVKDMGIETKSLVSSPLLLADIEDPANTTFIIAGVERDTLSLPQFSSDGFLTFASEDGWDRVLRPLVDVLWPLRRGQGKKVHASAHTETSGTRRISYVQFGAK